MPRSFPFAKGRVEGENAPISPTAEELNLEAILGATALLGHDVAYLAADCGLSARELNKQREHQAVDDEGGPAALGRQWAYRLGLIFRSARRRYGAERCAPLLRMLAREAGFVTAGTEAARVAGQVDPIVAVAAVMREVGDLVAKASARIQSGGGLDAREARELQPEIDEAKETIAALEALIHERAVPRRVVIARKQSA